jgi:16S rRNA (adenine1518-N6/adenine1519-N6)-dimethyltransferase
MTDPIASLPPLRDVITRHGLQAKKSLGQNFLLDLNLTSRIARAAGPLEGRTILEVGPGPGGLTRALLSEGAARVIAIERDERCLPALAEISAAAPGRLIVDSNDAMRVDERALLAQHGIATPIPVIANLPYNIGTALLIKWLTLPEWPPWYESLTLMFQREVAERMIASVGDDAYGRLSIITQWRARPRILFDVNPRAFTPVPKITSSIVRIEPLAEPIAPASLKMLERVTGAAFSQRRKMLRSSLKSLGAPTEALLFAAGLEPTARAEEISIAGFAALARAYEAIAPRMPDGPQSEKSPD